jgi:hypothetical protein
MVGNSKKHWKLMVVILLFFAIGLVKTSDIQASHYENESSVAAAVRRSGLPREQLFLVTKIWFDDMGERTSEALQESLLLGGYGGYLSLEGAM